MFQQDVGLSIMWIVLAQLGVKIDTIQDNMVINFSVPSMSDYTAQTNAMPLVGNAPKGEAVAGEMLLAMANNFFSENGFTPNGRIRSEYWTNLMGELASEQMQKEMSR